MTDRQTDNRNYGIDALRLLSMFFVTVLHTLGHGGVLRNTVGIKNDIAYLLEIIAYCAVNCYAIISGFVMYTEKEKPYRYSKYITMWLQVFFYSFGIGLLLFIVNGSDFVSIKELIKCALPVITKRYWYFSAYTGLFFVIPFLNMFVRVLNKKRFIVLTILSILFCTAALPIDFLGLMGGYSMAWLVLLYVIGAGIKKFDIINTFKQKFVIFVLAFCVLSTWIFYVASPIANGMFVSYHSPTIILSAMCWVAIFAKLKMNNVVKKIIKFLSPAAFGVYLIHEQVVIRDNFINDGFLWICNLDWWLIPIVVLGCALSIFVVCLIIEELRIALFKLLGINKNAEGICFKVETFFRKNINKILDCVD